MKNGPARSLRGMAREMTNRANREGYICHAGTRVLEGWYGAREESGQRHTTRTLARLNGGRSFLNRLRTNGAVLVCLLFRLNAAAKDPV